MRVSTSGLSSIGVARTSLDNYPGVGDSKPSAIGGSFKSGLDEPDWFRSAAGEGRPSPRGLTDSMASLRGGGDNRGSFRLRQSAKFSASMGSSASLGTFGKVPVLTGRSLLLFGAGPGSPLRLALAEFSSGPVFEGVMVTLIVLGSLMLAIDSPRLDPGSATKATVDILNRILIVIFAAEVTL